MVHAQHESPTKIRVSKHMRYCSMRAMKSSDVELPMTVVIGLVDSVVLPARSVMTLLLSPIVPTLEFGTVVADDAVADDAAGDAGSSVPDGVPISFPGDNSGGTGTDTMLLVTLVVFPETIGPCCGRGNAGVSSGEIPGSRSCDDAITVVGAIVFSVVVVLIASTETLVMGSVTVDGAVASVTAGGG